MSLADEFINKRHTEDEEEPQVQLERRGGLFNRFSSMNEEDEALSKTEAIRYLNDYVPSELRDLSLTRWRKREIPLIANLMTQVQATNPDRPRYPDLVDPKTDRIVKRGRKIPLGELRIHFMALLRLAEEGQSRDELMGAFRISQEQIEPGKMSD